MYCVYMLCVSTVHNSVPNPITNWFYLLFYYLHSPASVYHYGYFYPYSRVDFESVFSSLHTNTHHTKCIFFLSFCNIIKMSIYWLFIQFCYIFIFFHRIADPSQRENLGIIVQYKVKVKLCIGSPILGGYVSSCFRSALDIYIHKYTEIMALNSVCVLFYTIET